MHILLDSINLENKVLWNEPICELQNCKRRFTSYKSYRVLQHNYLPKPAHQSHTQSNHSQTRSLAKTLQSVSTSLPPYSKYSQVIDTHNTILSKSRIWDWEHEDTATLEVRQISIWLDSITHLNLPQQGGRWKRLHRYHQTVASWIRCRDKVLYLYNMKYIILWYYNNPLMSDGKAPLRNSQSWLEMCLTFNNSFNGTIKNQFEAANYVSI